MMKKTLCVNFFGGPGVGKSSISAGLFFRLKQRGINCELINEYAKGKVWEESYRVLDNQLYVLAKQYHRQFILKGKVDVMITDSPILLSLFYGRDLSPSFGSLVKDLFAEYENLNFFIERGEGHVYQNVGRLQNEEEADQIHKEIKKELQPYDYTSFIRINRYIDLDKIERLVLERLEQ